MAILLDVLQAKSDSKVCKKSVTFEGNSLTIKSLSMEQALVEGFIINVEFSG